MDSEACPFSVLPVDACHSILTQAFQQLDQRHLLTIIPLVCHLWHQLSLSTCTSLEVKLTTEVAVHQLASWILKHGYRLLKLNLNVVTSIDVVPLLQALPAATQLKDLQLTFEEEADLGHVMQSVSGLTKLTSLSITNGETFPLSISSLLSLTQLRSLSLVDTSEWGYASIHSIASSLVQLTSLDLSGSDLEDCISHFSALRSLTGLQELRLDDIIVPSQLLAELDGLPVTAIGISFRTAGDVSVTSSWLRPRLTNKLESVWLTDWEAQSVIEGSDLVRLLPAFSAAGPQLKELELHLAHLSPVVSQVTGLTQLTRVVLSYGTLDQGALCKLSTLSGLQHLSLEDSTIDAAWAEGAVLGLVAALAQLTRLALCNEDAVTPSILQALGSRVKSHLRNVLKLRQQE